MTFADRMARLPYLGLGLSTEYGALESHGALDPRRVHAQHPDYAAFLEVGVEVSKGLDELAGQWAAQGLPTTYHFLDINLDEPEDFDADWLSDVRALAAQLKPAWLCGDAGLWHFGRRERGHMLLLPPILSRESAQAQARGIVHLREATGYEIFPENPPGQVFLGDMPLLDYFAQVIEAADTGLLLDCAHLAIYQRLTGRAMLDGLDNFPLERVIEIHVAGGTLRDHEGFGWIDDDHSQHVLQDTWTIFNYVVERATSLRAVVFECERQPFEVMRPDFRRLHRSLRHVRPGATGV